MEDEAQYKAVTDETTAAQPAAQTAPRPKPKRPAPGRKAKAAQPLLTIDAAQAFLDSVLPLSSTRLAEAVQKAEADESAYVIDDQGQICAIVVSPDGYSRLVGTK